VASLTVSEEGCPENPRAATETSSVTGVARQRDLGHGHGRDAQVGRHVGVAHADRVHRHRAAEQRRERRLRVAAGVALAVADDDDLAQLAPARLGHERGQRVAQARAAVGRGQVVEAADRAQRVAEGEGQHLVALLQRGERAGELLAQDLAARGRLGEVELARQRRQVALAQAGRVVDEHRRPPGARWRPSA
jgi:hypothetical protein